MTDNKQAKQHQIGDRPIEASYAEKMKQVAALVDKLFNTGEKRAIGWVLMAFPFEGDGRCNYMSNAAREDVITLLREQLAYFEGMPADIQGRA